MSWTVEDGPAFDSFVIEVANSAGGPERQNLSVSGDARSLWMSGLSPDTSYTITLYGVHQGSILGSIYIEEATGTHAYLHIPGEKEVHFSMFFFFFLKRALIREIILNNNSVN